MLVVYYIMMGVFTVLLYTCVQSGAYLNIVKSLVIIQEVPVSY